MRRERLVNSWQARMLLVVMILVTGAVGLGPADGDAHATTHHGMCLDLCAGQAILPGAPVLVVFAQGHPVPGNLALGVYAVSLHRLYPPPKSPALS